LHRTDECRHENADGEADDRDLHAHIRRLIKIPLRITQVVVRGIADRIKPDFSGLDVRQTTSRTSVGGRR
jgi:hypothetical protein